MTTTLNKNPNASLSRALRLLLYLVLIGIAIYQFSQRANRAPLEQPEPKSPEISYVPSEQSKAKSGTKSEELTDSTEQRLKKPAVKKLEPPQLPSTNKPAPKVETKTAEKVENNAKPQSKIRTLIEKQTIRDQDGNVIFSGTIDLSETIARIQRGRELTQFRHDGIVFENRERRLPQHGAGYYREWVHPTPDERGPGPQRVITGENGEFWYSSNHYKSFIKLN